MNEYELDNFRPNKVPIVRTPIKTRDQPKSKPALTNKQNLSQHQMLQTKMQIKQPRKSLGQYHSRKHSQFFPPKTQKLKSKQRKQSQGTINIKDNKQCHNHPNKLAQFMIIVQNQPLTYCQKCAVMLASQKFKVMPLIQSTSKTRKQQINHFMGQLKSIIISMNNGMDGLQKRRNAIAGHYSNQRKIIQDYYYGLIRYLQHTRDRTLKALDLTQQKQVRLVQLYLDEIQEGLKQMKNIQRDISTNYQVIMHQVQQSSYRPIIVNYQQKCQHAQIKIQQIFNLPKEVVGVVQQNLQMLSNQFNKTVQSQFQLKMRKSGLTQQINHSKSSSYIGRPSHTPYRHLAQSGDTDNYSTAR